MNEETEFTGSKVVLRRPAVEGQRQMVHRDNHLLDSEDEEEEEAVDNTDGSSESPKDEVRIASSSGEYFDDDERSSICSDTVYCGRDLSRLPSDLPTKYSTWDRNFKPHKKESLVEALEKQQRESIGNRLKAALNKANKRHSISSVASEMPIIAKRNPPRDTILPKQTRRSSYQPVIITPFFRTISSAQSRALGFGCDAKERRNSITGPRAQTPTRSFFPLRETESLSGVEHFVEPSERHSPPSVSRHRFQNSVDNGSLDRLPTKIGSDQNAVSLNFKLETLEMTKSFDDDAAPTLESPFNRSPDVPETATNGDVNEAEKSIKQPSRVKDSEVEPKIVPPVTKSPPRPPVSEVLTPSERILSKQSKTSPPSPPTDVSSESSFLATERRFSNNEVTPLSRDKPLSRDASNAVSWSGFRTLQSHRGNELNRETPDVVSNATAEPRSNLSVTKATSDVPNVDPKNQKPSINGKNVDEKRDVDSTDKSKRYYSDIRIQLKEPESVIPTSSESSHQGVSTQLKNVRNTSREEIDSEDDSDSDSAVEVTPNWSSYPGQLTLKRSSSEEEEEEDDDDSEDFPKRNISTLEINMNPMINSAVTNSSKSSNADNSVQRTSQNRGDEAVSHRIKDLDPDASYRSFVHLNTTTSAGQSLQSTSSERPIQSSTVFVNCTTNTNATHNNNNHHREGAFDDITRCSNNSTERQEVFLVESRPTTSKSNTLPRYFGSPIRSNPTTRGNLFTSSERSNGLTPTNHEFSPSARARAAAPAINSNSTNTFYSKEKVDRPIAIPKARSNGAENISNGGRYLQSPPVVGSEDPNLTNCRRFEKTPSIERIWESIEEPHRQMLRRRIRFESDSGIKKSVFQETRTPGNRGGGGGGGERERPEARDAARLMRSKSTENGETHRCSVVLADSNDYSLLDIAVPKGGLGLGFCIEGGKDGPYGDRPITVKRLFRGSSDPKPTVSATATLRPGDEIISANGRDMTLLSRYVAWNYLKTLPDGTISLVVRRRQS